MFSAPILEEQKTPAAPSSPMPFAGENTDRGDRAQKCLYISTRTIRKAQRTSIVTIIQDLIVHLSSIEDVAVYWYRAAPITAPGGNSSSYRLVYGKRCRQVKRPSGGVWRVSSHTLPSTVSKRKSRTSGRNVKKRVSLHAKNRAHGL